MITLDKLKDLGYNAEEVAPRIFSIKDFATPEQTQQLFMEASSYTEEDWNFYYMSEMRKNCLVKFGRDDIENLITEGLLEVTSSWEDKNIQVMSTEISRELVEKAEEIFKSVDDVAVTNFQIYQRLYEGTQLIAHFDQYSDKLVQYAAVLYLNDDYTEGEIFFSKFNLQLRPTPGTLVIFPGTEDYEHGVHVVGPGPVRYVIPVFIKKVHPDGAMAGWADFG